LIVAFLKSVLELLGKYIEINEKHISLYNKQTLFTTSKSVCACFIICIIQAEYSFPSKKLINRTYIIIFISFRVFPSNCFDILIL